MTKHQVYHALLVGVCTGGLVELINGLQRVSASLANVPVSTKAVVVGTLTAALSRGLGVLIGLISTSGDQK